MEQLSTQGAGNGGITTMEEIIPGVDSAAASLESLDQQLRPYIEAHPFVAVGIAAGVGFLIGRLVSRL